MKPSTSTKIGMLIVALIPTGLVITARAEDTRNRSARGDHPGKETKRDWTHGTRLADVLPASVADFTRLVESDRLLDTEEIEMLNRGPTLAEVEPDAEVMIALLKPLSAVTLVGSVTVASTLLDPPSGRNAQKQVNLVAGTVVQLENGVRLAVGQQIPGDAIILTGLVLNAGATAVVVRTGDEETTIVSGGALNVIREDIQSEEDGTVATNSCSVSCGGGTCACCTYAGLFTGAKCKCLNCASATNCDAGGAGATSCSVSAQ